MPRSKKAQDLNRIDCAIKRLLPDLDDPSKRRWTFKRINTWLDDRLRVMHRT